MARWRSAPRRRSGPARRRSTVPASRSPACSRRRRRARPRRSPATPRCRSPPPPSARSRARRPPTATAPAARGRRCDVRRPSRGARATRRGTGASGSAAAGCASSMRRRAAGRHGRHPSRCLGCSRPDPRGWWGRPDARRRRAGRPPRPRGSPPVAGAPPGRRSRASCGSRSIRRCRDDFRVSARRRLDDPEIWGGAGDGRRGHRDRGRALGRSDSMATCADVPVRRATRRRGGISDGREVPDHLRHDVRRQRGAAGRLRRRRRASPRGARQGLSGRRQRRGALDATRTTTSPHRSTRTS